MSLIYPQHGIIFGFMYIHTYLNPHVFASFVFNQIVATPTQNLSSLVLLSAAPPPTRSVLHAGSASHPRHCALRPTMPSSASLLSLFPWDLWDPNHWCKRLQKAPVRPVHLVATAQTGRKDPSHIPLGWTRPLRIHQVLGKHPTIHQRFGRNSSQPWASLPRLPLGWNAWSEWTIQTPSLIERPSMWTSSLVAKSLASMTQSAPKTKQAVSDPNWPCAKPKATAKARLDPKWSREQFFEVEPASAKASWNMLRWNCKIDSISSSDQTKQAFQRVVHDGPLHNKKGISLSLSVSLSLSLCLSLSLSLSLSLFTRISPTCVTCLTLKHVTCRKSMEIVHCRRAHVHFVHVFVQNFAASIAMTCTSTT